MCKLESPEMKSTVDPHLSGPHVSGRSDYPNYEMTVLLECFAVSVHSIRVFDWDSVWVSIIRTFQLSEHTVDPMSSNK